MTERFERVIFGSNLKMYKTNRDTVEYLTELQRLTGDIPRELIDLFILPSYTALADACRSVDPALISIGAQNVHWEPQGQFTGEVSIPMLQDAGVNLVMIGHAERREKFGETDLMVNQRVLACLNNGLRVLICIGDTLQEREMGVCEDILARQLKIALHNVIPEQLSRVWLAYEPVWAIGEKGIVAAPELANSVHAYLHDLLVRLYPDAGRGAPVLYGGSVNLDNAAEMISQPDIDGLFVGRAAWNAANFNQMIRASLKALPYRI
jgi:triosephosphate isomerase